MSTNIKSSLATRSPWHSITERFNFWPKLITFSLLIVLITSVALAYWLAQVVEKQMLMRDSIVTAELVNTIVLVEKATPYFSSMNTAYSPIMEEFFEHIAALPGVVEAHVYGEKKNLLWSSWGQRPTHWRLDNDALNTAFRGEIAPHIERVDKERLAARLRVPDGVEIVVENYLPIWSLDMSRVIGVVELYKLPGQLLTGAVWSGALGAALALSFSLGLIVLHAKRVIRKQQARSVEMERLAVVGEMTSAVAHGLRNPLASIRSCAELALDDDLPIDSREAISDIVDQSDRLESWIRSFLIRAQRESNEERAVVQIDPIITDCLSSFSVQMRSRNIECVFEPEGDSPLVVAPQSELYQVLHSVIANSIEAMESDGCLTITRIVQSNGKLCLMVSDTGPGFTDASSNRFAHPFVTTKTAGLGVGLALARGIVDRIGGTLELRNGKTRGAEICIRIPFLTQVA